MSRVTQLIYTFWFFQRRHLKSQSFFSIYRIIKKASLRDTSVVPGHPPPPIYLEKKKVYIKAKLKILILGYANT